MGDGPGKARALQKKIQVVAEVKVSCPVCAARRVVVSLLQAGGMRENIPGLSVYLEMKEEVLHLRKKALKLNPTYPSVWQRIAKVFKRTIINVPFAPSFTRRATTGSTNPGPADSPAAYTAV